MRPPEIHIENFSLEYHGEVLFDRFSMLIGGGRCTCLLGPSGCGKSTLLKLISGNGGLDHTGTVRFSPECAVAGTVSWMAQNDLLLPWLTVRANVTLGARLRRQEQSETREKAERLLAAGGLADKGHLLPGQLSGGMRQRVALLRTLMEQRSVLLMDEPFSALDALNRARLQNLTAGMTAGLTVVMVTHDPLEALRLADRILVLQGRPVQIVESIELHGRAPRELDNAELQRVHPILMRRLLGEVA